MNYSFYGGNRGSAFVIVERFRYVQKSLITDYDRETIIDKEWGEDLPIKTFEEWVLRYCMKEAFAQGGNYTGVNYDEYVIIDSFNKNDADNGKVYRRGYDYSDDLGGAQYIGQIVGPAGLAPQVEMATIAEIEAMYKEEDTKNFEYRKSSGDYKTDNSLVPGAVIDGYGTAHDFEDKISWKCYSIRDKYNKDTTAYVAFRIPYKVLQVTAGTVDAYYHRDDENESTTTFNNINLSDRVDDKTHPFFEHWDLKIPKGIKGDTFNNFRVMVAASSIEAYDGQADDIANSRKVLVYDLWVYDRIGTGDKKTYYVGDYNKINKITTDADGTLTVYYDHDDPTVFSKKIRWIDRMEILTGESEGKKEGEGSQKLKIYYNDGTTSIIGDPLNYVMETAMSDNYHLLVRYSDPARREKIKEEGKSYTFGDYDDWHDLGDIKADNGILVGLHYDTDEYPQLVDISSAIAYLNEQWPAGLIETEENASNDSTYANITGKLVAVGAAQENKNMFAFNYRYATSGGTTKGYVGWFFLGVFSALDIVCGRLDDENTQAVAKTLPTGGIWLVTVPRTNVTES